MQSCPVLSFYGKTLEVSTSQKDNCLLPKNVMILTQGHFDKFKVTWKKSAESVSSVYLSNEETLEVPNLHNYCLWLEGVSLSWLKSTEQV